MLHLRYSFRCYGDAKWISQKILEDIHFVLQIWDQDNTFKYLLQDVT